jgi:hypothetical protein
MAKNMIESMQETMRVRINRIDPSDPNGSKPMHPESVDCIAQATIPTALIGTLAKLTKINSDNLEDFRQMKFSIAFGNKREEITKAIAKYADTTYEHADMFLKRAFDTMNDILNDRFHGDWKALRTALEDGQNTILEYLPASIGLGNKIDIKSIDDPTHNMNGILSSITNYLFNEDIQTKEDNK